MSTVAAGVGGSAPVGTTLLGQNRAADPDRGGRQMRHVHVDRQHIRALRVRTHHVRGLPTPSPPVGTDSSTSLSSIKVGNQSADGGPAHPEPLGELGPRQCAIPVHVPEDQREVVPAGSRPGARRGTRHPDTRRAR